MTEHERAPISIIYWFIGTVFILGIYLFMGYYTEHPEKKLPFSYQARQCKTLFVRISQACQSISPTNDFPGGRASREPSPSLGRANHPGEPLFSSPCSSGAASTCRSPIRTKGWPPEDPPGGRGSPEPSPSPCSSGAPPPETPKTPSFKCPAIDNAATDRAVRAAISPIYSELGNYLQLSDIKWKMDQAQIARGIDVNAEAINAIRHRIAAIETSALTRALFVHGDHACWPRAAEPINIVNGMRNNDTEKLITWAKHRLWLIEQAKHPWRDYGPKLKAQVFAMSAPRIYELIGRKMELERQLETLMWGRYVDIIYMTAPVWPYRYFGRLIHDTRNHMPAKKE